MELRLYKVCDAACKKLRIPDTLPQRNAQAFEFDDKLKFSRKKFISNHKKTLQYRKNCIEYRFSEDLQKNSKKIPKRFKNRKAETFSMFSSFDNNLSSKRIMKVTDSQFIKAIVEIKFSMRQSKSAPNYCHNSGHPTITAASIILQSPISKSLKRILFK